MAEKLSKEQVAYQKELNALYKTGAISLKQFNTFLAEGNTLKKGQLQNATNHFKKEQQITKEKQKQLAIDKKQADVAMKKAAAKEAALKKEQALQEKINKLEDERIDIASTLQTDLVKNKKAFEGIAKRSADVGKNMVAAYKEQMKGLDLRTKEGRAAKANLQILIDQTEEQNKIAQSLELIAGNDALAATFQDAQDLASDTAKKIGGLFSKIPGGNALFKALGGLDLEEQLQKGVTTGFAAMAKSMAKGNDLTTSLKDGMGAFANVVKGIPNIGMILGIGAVIAGVGILLSVFKDISKSAHELSESAGITYTEAKRLNKEARAAQASFDNQLATFEDITAIQKELVDGLGSAALVSTEIAANIADTAKAFGVSAETAGAVTNALIAQGNTQEEVAKIQMEANAMAVKAGVNVAAVQQDIADNAAAAAEFIGGSGIELAKAAVEAAKLGVTLDQLVKTSDQLLDIESSLQKQFRAQALTGKSLNFDKARQLALEGDIIGAQKEMLKQAGSLEDFNSMNVVQRRALADAMGMEVGDLQKSLTLQKMRGKLTDDEIAAASGLNKSAAELANMSADQIKKELAKKNAAEKTAAAFDTLKNDLTAALAPAAQAFADIFSALSPVIKGLGFALKIAFFPITLAGNALKFIVDLMGQFKNITAGVLTLTTLILAKKNEQLILDTALNAKALVLKGYESAILLIKQAKNAVSLKGIGIAATEMIKTAASGAMVLGKAVASLFGTFAQIPFGVGIPLAIAAAGGLFALFKKAQSAGDVGISPKGGPIVASPREGAIFQGTANDGVEMSPTAGVPGAGGGGGTAVIDSGQLTQMITALQGILTAVQSPPPVVIGDSQLAGISNNISARNSFKV